MMIIRRNAALLLLLPKQKQVISVKDKKGIFSTPIRIETGLERIDLSEIETRKRVVSHTNFNFLKTLLDML